MVDWTTVIKDRIKNLFFTQKINIRFDSTDLVLSEFPKSGITYLSFLLATYFRKFYQIEKDLNFFNLNDFVHDVHITQRKPKCSEIAKYTGFKIFKTHQSECKQVTKFIYLIRNPVSCIQSYVDHFKSFYSSEISFSTLLRTQTYGLEAWINHVNNWTLTKRPTGMAILNYEMLCSEPDVYLKRIVNLIGFKVHNNSLKYSVNYCSRKNMQKIENDSSCYCHKKSNFGKSFVKLTQRKTNNITNNDLNYIYKHLKIQKNAYIQNYYKEIFEKNSK